MSLLHLSKISFGWESIPLFDEIDLRIERGERIGLVGRNGCGKSTLMKVIAGEIAPDHGAIRRSADLRVARLAQEVPGGDDRTVSEFIMQGVVGADDNHGLDHAAAARNVQRIETRMGLRGDAQFRTLSSGMKRRVLLAQSIVSDPDLLLLDEPTNHLDVESISWLERFLSGYSATLLFVTHDRVFLETLATRILEIDLGRLFDWTCDYATFLKRKQAAIEAEEKQNAHFERVLAKEEAWIRQGIKARRTRNEGRVKALKRMRDEARQRRKRIGQVRMQAVEADRSGDRVIEADKISFAYGETPIVQDFSTLISRGDKIGLIGPNGAGKTTLLKLLLGELKPDRGVVRHGTRLEVLYFDQLREQIDDEKSVAENVGEGQENLLINGKSRHIFGYLQDFLFTPERARLPAKVLSGGERNRLLLARMFKRSSNVLVLDEPTNDLDLETLELLEELVLDYAGTLLLVSHDRAFLNHVVTSTLVFEENGRLGEYAGGYDDYIRQRDEQLRQAQTNATQSVAPAKTPVRKAERSSKLTFKEQRELESLPGRIEVLEEQVSELHDRMADPSFYKQTGDVISQTKAKLAEKDTELQELYARWEQLDGKP